MRSHIVLSTLLLFGIVYFPVSLMAQRGCTSFRPEVDVLIKKVGEPVSIYCSNDDAPVFFKKGNQRLTDDDSKVEGSLVANERVLRIGNVAMSDAGLYECVGIGDTECASVNLRVHDEIRFTSADNEALQYIMEGRSGSITCTAESDSDITYEWYVGERKITRDGNAGDNTYRADEGTLRLTGAKKLVEHAFTCRASLKDFSYFRDLTITVGLLEGEPLNCLTCSHTGTGTMSDDDPCAKGTGITTTTECDSSCVTINATGPAKYDGTYKYGTIRGCGDKLSIFKERCIDMPNSKLQMGALSMLGDVAGLTHGTVCFCSSGDKCNKEARKYYSAASGCANATPVVGCALGTLILFVLAIFQY